MPTPNPYQPMIDALDQRIAAGKALLDDPELGSLASQEVAELEKERAQLMDAAAQLQGGGESSDGTTPQITNCIIEVRQGAGGDEAKIWANDLFRMYIKFIESSTLKYELLEELTMKVRGRIQPSDLAKSAEQPLANDTTPAALTAYELLRYESGVHRVQRVPATEAQGRIHTSTASVAVIPEVQKNAVTINEGELEWQFMRAGGAGGQNVNKVNSAVRLTHVPTGLTVSSRRERSQAQNREIALEMLRGQLWELQEEQRRTQLGEARAAIGRAQRAEKIRTYNYPQNRVTDHRLMQSWHSLDMVMEGRLGEVLLAMQSLGSPTEKTTD